MHDIKVSCGIWFLGATSDRFVKQGYRPDRTIEERFRLAASIPGVGGLEMHYPTEVTDHNYKSLKRLADDLGMKIVQFCPHFWVDPRWMFGQFSNPDRELRRAAIDLAKRTTDLAAYMQAEVMVYWPAQDGFDYPFQIDHRQRLENLVECLTEWVDYNPQQKIVVEYKAFEPRTHIMLPTIGHCMTIVNEINRPNFGVNIDMGHALIMKENLAESIALCCRYGKLFHTHWNDNWKLFDDDVIVGTVNLWETLEALFWLREWGYDGWYGLDLFPYREPAEKAVDESIRNLKFGFELLDRVPKEELLECFQTSDAIKISQLMRRMLGGA
ncbi:MAG TPA: sugar phosphate isomerase/epimerase family protein [Anaerolineales bacterium]